MHKTKILGILTSLFLAMSFFISFDLKTVYAEKSKEKTLEEMGIIKGNDGGLLEDEVWKRKDVTILIARLLGKEVEARASLNTHGFSDINNANYNGYISWAKKEGIFNGYSSTTFGFDDSITFQQLAAVLVRTLNINTPNLPQMIEGPSEWAKGYVQAAMQLNLLPPASNFKEPAKRDELVLGTFQTLSRYDAASSHEVRSAEFLEDNKLSITLSTWVDSESIDLSNITINGVPLNPTKDSFEVSKDLKTIIITLHPGYQIDPTKVPEIKVEGLSSKLGSKINPSNENGGKIPVKVTVPPVYTPPVTDDNDDESGSDNGSSDNGNNDGGSGADDGNNDDSPNVNPPVGPPSNGGGNDDKGNNDDGQSGGDSGDGNTGGSENGGGNNETPPGNLPGDGNGMDDGGDNDGDGDGNNDDCDKQTEDYQPCYCEGIGCDGDGNGDDGTNDGNGDDCKQFDANCGCIDPSCYNNPGDFCQPNNSDGDNECGYKSGDDLIGLKKFLILPKVLDTSIQFHINAKNGSYFA